MTLQAPPAPNIISASRRTDIPAFFLAEFMASVERGEFESVNPFNRRRRQVSATPAHTHSIVFWSKNYGPLLDARVGSDLRRRGYRLVFHFTINSPDPLLESRLPPLAERLAQLETLVRTFGPQAIVWRFDPICHYQRPDEGRVHHNLTHLSAIAAKAADLGLRSCITSFVDPYPKVRQRFARAGIRLVDPPIGAKVRILTDMARKLAGHGIALETCCENTVMRRLPSESGVLSGACISAGHLSQLYGPNFQRRLDRGQRRQLGCGCNVAVDIGDYQTQPCAHACLYCYARPQTPAPGEPAPPRPAPPRESC